MQWSKETKTNNDPQNTTEKTNILSIEQHESTKKTRVN